MIGLGLSLPTVAISSAVTVAEPVPETLTFLTAGSSTWQVAFEDDTGPANSAVTVSTTGTSFAPLGTTGRGATVFGDQMNKATGAPIRLLRKAVSGTQLAQWEANGSTQRASAVAAANAAGGITALLWAGGINDARDGVVTSQAAHAAKLRSLFGKFRSELGMPNLPIFIQTSQKITTGSAGASVFNPQVVMVRSAEMDLINNDANVYLYTHTLDLTQKADALHQDAAAYTLSSTRGAASVAAFLANGSTLRGPRILSAVAVSDTQTRVTFSGAITPATGITGFQISTNGFTTVTTPTAGARVSGQAAQVLLTHPSTGTAVTTAQLRYQELAAPDVSGPIFSDTTPALPADYTTPSGVITFQTIAGAVTPSQPKSALVNFGRAPATTPLEPGWNDFGGLSTDNTPANGATLALNQPDGTPSGWNIIVDTRPVGGASTGLAETGVFPANVLATYWFTDGTITNSAMRIRGLDSAKKYRIEVAPSRGAITGPRITRFTVAGVSQSVDAANNKTLSAIFNDVVPVNGEIAVSFGNGSGATNGYLNGMKINEIS